MIKLMKRIFLLTLIALIYATVVRAQPPTQTRPMLDYSFAPAIPLGTHIGDHIFQNNIRVSGPVAFDDSGRVAFYGQWFGAAVGGGNAKGVYTSNRVVVEEGSKVGQSVVVAIINVRAGDLQMNGSGQVAYLATIDSKLCGTSSSCTGLFVDRDLRAITPSPTATYVLAEDGKIQSSAAGFWLKPAVASGSKKSWLGPVAATVQPMARQVKVPVLGPMVIAPKPVEVGQKAQTVANGNQSAGFTAPTAYPNCPLPTGFEFPALWSGSANGAGPIGSTVPQQAWGLVYRTASQATKSNWQRKAFFSYDCRAILVAATQFGAPTADELWTPSGLLASFDAANGVYHFAPVGDALLPPSSSPIEDGIRINRKCQVLILVTLRAASSSESALILATPNSPGHCQ